MNEMSGTHRIPARALVSDEVLHRVRERSAWKGTWLVLHAWTIIGLAMALVAWLPNPLTWLVAVAIIGSRQLGLAILMHEGAHGGLARNHRTNLWLSQWLCAYPVFAETVAYRKYHLQHHAHAQTRRDPDLVLSAPFPVSKTSLRRKILRDLTGQTGFKQRRAQFVAASGDPSLPAAIRLRLFAKALGRPLLVNAILFAALAATGRWWLYPLLWIVPLLTWQQLVSRIRNIAEHAVMPVEGDPFSVARTTLANPLERLFLAPYWVNYHAEHHLLMYVPCYNLPALHRSLMSSDNAGRIEVKRGYASVLQVAAP